MEKLLSIAIPTFNRELKLKEELECILPQLLKYKAEVEIVISDNASPESDHTATMVEEMEKKYGIPINYNKLNAPIYFEDNFKEVVNRSNGKYIHMTGDDDLFAPDFYDVVFNLIEKEYGLIHFNRLEGDADCSNTRVYDKIREKMVYSGSTAEIAKRVMRSPGFMTSLIFSRECWNAGERFEKDNYYGYHFLGRLYLGAMDLKKNSCYYYMPLIIARNNNHDWGKMFPLFYYVGYSNIFKDADTFAPGIYDSWIDFLHNKKRKSHMKRIVTILKDKDLYIEKYDEMMEYLSSSQKRAFRFLIHTRLPQKIVAPLYCRLVDIFYHNM